MSVRQAHIYINPVTKAVLMRDWEKGALDAQLHAYIGDDSDRMVNAVGRTFYVILCAAMTSGLTADDVDVRIVRGAVNAMGEQAGDPEIHQAHRASIVSGLTAVSRLVSRIERKHLIAAVVDLALKLRRGDVWLEDFQKTLEKCQ